MISIMFIILDVHENENNNHDSRNNVFSYTLFLSIELYE